MKNILVPLAVCLALAGCKSARTTGGDDGRLELRFIQVNDVYEIAPLANGTAGGVARIATIKKEQLQENPNTLLVMAGDFVSPSVYNNLRYEGARIRGRQMVAAMNSAGFDYVVFGNHEFDISEKELQDRLNESKFEWISSNAFHKTGGSTVPFSKTNGASSPEYKIVTLTDADGTVVKLGIIGSVMTSNPAEYVSYTDPNATVKRVYDRIKDSCDLAVAITHQDMEADIALAKLIPGLAAILGGHEHDMRYEKVGSVLITKAHANARSAYLVKMVRDKKTKTTQVAAELKELNTAVRIDEQTDQVVQRWLRIADSSFTASGFNAREVVLARGEALDGREVPVRREATALTKLIVEAMIDACPEADGIVFNGGSIRVDDVLNPPITQYDVIRILPFGGPIKEADIKGKLLVQILEAGRKNRGTGGYLHLGKISESGDDWLVAGQRVEPEKVYRIAMSDFLLTGREANLGFLTPGNPDVVKVHETPTAVNDARSDIRLAIIRYFRKK